MKERADPSQSLVIEGRGAKLHKPANNTSSTQSNNSNSGSGGIGGIGGGIGGGGGGGGGGGSGGVVGGQVSAESVLMPWNGRAELMIDRFDVRAFMDVIPRCA